MASTIFVVRHGQRADRHRTERKFPISFDPCLTEIGLEQAEITASKIAGLIPSGSRVHLVSSPFFRCLESASKFSNLLNVPIHLEEGFGESLLECDFSSCPFDHLTYKTMTHEQLEQKIGARVHINDHVLRPQFPEHLRSTYARVRHSWELYSPKIQEEVLIIVTHLYVLGGLTSVFTGRQEPIDESGYCKITHVERTPQNTYQIHLNCDYSHLRH